MEDLQISHLNELQKTRDNFEIEYKQRMNVVNEKHKGEIGELNKNIGI
jgi:hypothetical protein